MKPALRTALWLAAVVTTDATACGPGVYLCACPPNVFPLVVCGTFLNRHGSRLEPAMPVPLSARNRRVARAPAHSVIPRPAGWGVKNIAMDAITISTNCAHAPVVTVTPLAAARTLAVARANNGGIAGLILAHPRHGRAPPGCLAAGAAIRATETQHRCTACPARSFRRPTEPEPGWH